MFSTKKISTNSFYDITTILCLTGLPFPRYPCSVQCFWCDTGQSKDWLFIRTLHPSEVWGSRPTQADFLSVTKLCTQGLKVVMVTDPVE